MHHHVDSSQDLSSALRQRGLKVTPNRLQVMAILHEADQPISITDVIARTKDSKTFKVTVYRVLADLKDAGLVRQVDFQQPHAYYEPADPADHHHLVCLNCRKVEDFTGCDADRIATQALQQSKSFSTVSTHSFELFGLCKSCQTA